MKKKMSNRKFRAITIPIVAVAFTLCQVATIGMTSFSVAMDDYLGKGEMNIVQAEGREDWDTKTPTRTTRNPRRLRMKWRKKCRRKEAFS